MMNFLPSFVGFQGLDSCAFVAPTLSPRPFPPRRAGKGANSRIWPTLFIDVLHAVRQWAKSIKRSIDRRFHCFLAAVYSGLTHTASKTNEVQNISSPAHCCSACKTSVKTRGQIWLLAPLSVPAGVERGGGDRGGMKRQNCQHHRNKTKPKLNWNLTPMKRGEDE
jgi:hypothetical protein